MTAVTAPLVARPAAGRVDDSSRVLLSVDDRRPFAYARNRREFRRLADDSIWAREVNGWLMSERSGRRLAFRVGDFYLDAATLSLLYVVSYQSTDVPG